jgi:hypothetical protein
MSLGEDVMDRKEVVEMCMESPFYFSMPLKMRLEFVKGHEGSYSSNGLREDLLIWVKTGRYSSSNQDHFS